MKRTYCRIALGVLSLALMVMPESPKLAAQTWTLSGSMNVPRASHVAVLLEDGQVLVAGGANSTGFPSSAELFDLATGVWNVTGSIVSPGGLAVAVRLQDGRVLFAGDPSSGTWSQTGSMNVARAGFTATPLQIAAEAAQVKGN